MSQERRNMLSHNVLLMTFLPRVGNNLREGRKRIVDPSLRLGDESSVYHATDVVFALVIEPSEFLRRGIKVSA